MINDCLTCTFCIFAKKTRKNFNNNSNINENVETSESENRIISLKNYLNIPSIIILTTNCDFKG